MTLNKDVFEDKYITRKIKYLSKQFSFDVCKITSSKLSEIVQSNLKDFISKGYHGDMSWIRSTFERRKCPKSLWPDAKTAIVLGMNYGPKTNPLENLLKIKRGNISVYALGDDYHKVMKGKIKQFASKLIPIFKKHNKVELKVFVDTAPLMEKPIAQIAGIGWQGKHTNLVSKDYGSWLFLGIILLNQKLIYDKPKSDLCGNCNKCIDICPTQAIVKPYQLDARKCISYLTIEYKGKIPEEFRRKIGNRIYGCDDCLSICPWNKFAKISNEARFQDKQYDLNLSRLLKLNNNEFKKTFSRSPIKRIGRERFLRNCCIAAGNSKNKKLIGILNYLNINEKSELIKDASSWAIKELDK